MAAINGFGCVNYGDPSLAVYTVPGTKVRVSLRREVAPLLLAVMAEWNAKVEPLDPHSCWGHAYRPIRGSSTDWSFHAPGIAVDLNASRHPLGKHGTFTPAQRARISRIVAGHTWQGQRLLRWGGNYTGRVDEMHVEIVASRPAALAAVAALTEAKPTMTTNALPYPGRTSFYGSPASATVTAIQRALARNVGYTGGTGPFGPKTRQAVLLFQTRNHLAVDGIVGPKTWAALRPTR